MLIAYFKIAFRSLLKNKLHTIINITGLALGLSSVFFIAVYIQGELSYDKFHRDAENLYRISWESDNPQTRTPHPMAQALVNDFPEVENAVSLSPLWSAGLTRETHSFRNPAKDARYDETNLLAVDTTFFDVFTFPIVKGDANALKNIRGLLISESMAKKYFGDEDPIGKQLMVDGDNYLVEVRAVFKDVPVNSHMHFDFLVSYLREKSFDPDDEYYKWGDFGHYNYIRVKPGTDIKDLESRIMTWSRQYIAFTDQEFESLTSQHHGFKLQPVTDIHLQSRLRWELEPNGNIEYIYLLLAAGILTLVIACINFMNLTSAKSTERAKEIGVRKTMGAFKAQLAMQFLSEAVVVSLFAVMLSLAIIQVSQPAFKLLTGTSVSFTTEHLMMLMGFGLLCGIIAGLYPSLYLANVDHQLILKGKFAHSKRGIVLRNTLTAFQFAMSMALITACVIIFRQLGFMQSKGLGYDQEELVVIPVKNERGFSKLDVFRNELLKINGVKAVSAASNIPGRQFNQHDISWSKFPNDGVAASEVFVDYDFFQTFGIALKEGRLFSRENAADGEGAFILNETAVNQLQIEGSAVGQEIVWNNDGHKIHGKVIGVVKDFNFQSLHRPVQPLLILPTKRAFNHIVIKVNTNRFNEKIAAIEKAYKVVEPVFGFEYTFLKDSLNRQYVAEQNTASILTVFSGISVLIACIGLFGMSMLMFYQRVKEISIRKVLGASPANLLILLASDFTRTILISIVIAVPLVWAIMNSWLQNFSYRVEIDPSVFVIAAVALLALSWGTLSYFSIKAYKLNAAETLKGE